MIETRVFGNLKESSYRTRFRIAAAVDEPLDSSIDQCTCTHRAGLLGDVDRCITQTPATEGLCGLSNRQHFGMGGGIGQGLSPISACAQNSFTDEHYSTNGNFSKHCCLRSFHQRESHPKDIDPILLVRLRRTKYWQTP